MHFQGIILAETLYQMTMKTILPTIGLLMAMVFVSGCKKESCSPDTDPVGPFRIGMDNGAVEVTTFDSTIKIIAPWHDYASENFDVDSDGVQDFQFYSEHSISPGGLNIQRSKIRVLNSAFQISAIEITDTTHRCTQIENDTIIAYVYYNNNSSYVCDGNSVDSILASAAYPYPVVYSIGDSLTSNIEWTGSDMILAELNMSYSGWAFPYTSWSVIRGNWNGQSMKYILFRKSEQDSVRHGWIQLSVNSSKEIRVYEFAIEKEGGE